jgi:hypothetical protein
MSLFIYYLIIKSFGLRGILYPENASATLAGITIIIIMVPDDITINQEKWT